ncbi:MAG: RNA methyltransferase [Nannocystaceae bacterium]
MPLEIRDPDDPRVAAYRGSDVADNAGPGRFVVETEHVVTRLLESEVAVESILVTPGRLDRVAPSLRGRARGEVEVMLAERPLLSAIVGYARHRGAAALGVRPAPVDPVAAARDLVGARGRLTILAAEGIVDPHNIGAILRAARAFAVDLVLLDRRCADPWSRRASRAAMGNNFAFHRRLAIVDDLARALVELRAAIDGLTIAAATVGEAAVGLDAFRRGPALALVVGNEGAGLSDALLSRVDLELTIPMAAGVDSLNAGAAAAVLLYAAGGLARR